MKILTRNNIKLYFATFILAVLAAGCSSIKTYPNNYTKNLVVTTTTSSDSFFLDVDAFLHIYNVNTKCEVDYQGTVDLDQPLVKVGLPTNKLLYLKFVFVKSGFLSSSSSSISSETLLKPIKGRKYEAEASYLDSMYDLEIWEKKSAKSRKRKLEKLPLYACKATK